MLRSWLQRVGELLVEAPHRTCRGLYKSLRPLFLEARDAEWYFHLAFALLQWNGGWLHPRLEAELPVWTSRDLRREVPALDIVVTAVASRHRVLWASFALDRLVFGLRAPRVGPRRVEVYVNERRVAQGSDLACLMALSEVSFIVREKQRWRAVYGATRSRPFDKVERLVVHGERPVYIVRSGTKRRVVDGAADGPPWERVQLPVWTGTMVEAAPEFFVDQEAPGPLVYAAKRPDGWTIVRDGAAEAHRWLAVADLAVIDGTPCYRAATRGHARRRRWLVVTKGLPSPSYDEIPRVSWVDGRAVYRARQGNHWRVVEGAREHPWYEELTEGTIRGGAPFYAGRDGREWWVHHGERRWGPYLRVVLLPEPYPEPNPELESDGEETSSEPVAWRAVLPDGSGEALCVAGTVLTVFESIVATHETTAGIVCAGHRAGRVIVRDTDGTEIASVARLLRFDPDDPEAYFERVDGQTWFVSQEGDVQRLHVGTWRSLPARAIVPLFLTSRDGPLYGMRERGAWWLCQGTSKRRVKKRPTMASHDDDGRITVFLEDGTSVDGVL
jgi:hypothetical protein